MEHLERQIPARYFAILMDLLERDGVDCAPLLRDADIRSLDDPQDRISLHQCEVLLAGAERASGRRDLGFELGKRVKISSHDILGYALLTSATLAQVLRLLSQYQRLITPVFSLRIRRSGRRVNLEYRPLLPVSERLMGVLLEATAVSNYFEFRSLLGGELPPYDLYLSIHRPDHADRYRQLASARVHFEDVQPGLTMSVDSALLERPVVMADPRAMAAAEARCRRMLGDVSNRRNWSDWCEMMLRDAEDCQPSLDRLASFVNVSARTLARYLEAEGVSFRALSLGVRIARARQLLAETDAPVTQIALRLGYSEVASFVRSFRRETGESPTEFRMRCGATVSAP